MHSSWDLSLGLTEAFTLGVHIAHSNYLRHQHVLSYHAQFNIFFTFPDDAVNSECLKSVKLSIAQGLNRVIYLLRNAASGRLKCLLDFSLSVILFLVGVIPCPERHNCSDCLHGDDFCYYCSSNYSCDYYRGSHDGNKCPKNNLFYDECPIGGSLFWVLFPILAIILIPVIVYAVVWLICWCMKSAGYDPLDPTEPPPKKHPKGIRLKPGSPSNRTDELRRKYDLDNS